MGSSGTDIYKTRVGTGRCLGQGSKGAWFPGHSVVEGVLGLRQFQVLSVVKLLVLDTHCLMLAFHSQSFGLLHIIQVEKHQAAGLDDITGY